MSLEELRKKIDDADERIVRLIADRIRQAQEIGEHKAKNGIPVEDATREERVLEHVRELARKEKISEKNVESIYRQIVAAARSVQGTTVAFQGEIGAYSEEAIFQFFGPTTQVKPLETLDAVFKAVEKGDVTFGVVPVENSLEGSISRVYDLFLDSALKVCGETDVRIMHCLIANPSASLDTIKRVYSHPQALGQAQAFLRHLKVELVSTYDTAGSVKLIKEKNITDGAAVASARAAEIYGMKILAREIEDNPNNFTRFFVLSREDAPPTGKDKTSIVFSVKHKPGALFMALKEFSDAGINLTKIESRPTRQRAWEYNFYLDLEGHRDDLKVKRALARLEEHSLFLKVIGSYAKAA
jgi:chorismate mutase/prephenate dehydratase